VWEFSCSWTPPLPLPFPPISEKAYIKNVLEPQILALKSHFFGSCVFVSRSHQFFFMRLWPKAFKSPWHSSQLKSTDHRRFKAFFFRESVRSVLCLTQFRHFSTFFIPTRKFCARQLRSNSSTPIDRIWLPNFRNAKMLHRRAMGFLSPKNTKAKTLKKHLTPGTQADTCKRQKKIYLIRRFSAAWFMQASQIYRLRRYVPNANETENKKTLKLRDM
jgi:hypothetical protein